MLVDEPAGRGAHLVAAIYDAVASPALARNIARLVDEHNGAPTGPRNIGRQG